MKEKRVELPDNLDFLKPVLETWLYRYEVIAGTFLQSEQHYYLESTLVSLLAGAAWCHNMQAITEVKIRRTSRGNNEANGRLDLLIQSKAGRIALEAKICWDHMLIPAVIHDWLDGVCSEVRSIERGAGDIMLGAVFFIPWCRTQAEKSQLTDNVAQSFANVRAEIKGIYFDSETEYPGVMLFARESSAP